MYGAVDLSAVCITGGAIYRALKRQEVWNWPAADKMDQRALLRKYDARSESEKIRSSLSKQNV